MSGISKAWQHETFGPVGYLQGRLYAGYGQTIQWAPADQFCAPLGRSGASQGIQLDEAVSPKAEAWRLIGLGDRLYYCSDTQLYVVDTRSMRVVGRVAGRFSAQTLVGNHWCGIREQSGRKHLVVRIAERVTTEELSLSGFDVQALLGTGDRLFIVTGQGAVISRSFGGPTAQDISAARTNVAIHHSFLWRDRPFFLETYRGETRLFDPTHDQAFATLTRMTDVCPPMILGDRCLVISNGGGDPQLFTVDMNAPDSRPESTTLPATGEIREAVTLVDRRTTRLLLVCTSRGYYSVRIADPESGDSIELARDLSERPDVLPIDGRIGILGRSADGARIRVFDV